MGTARGPRSVLSHPTPYWLVQRALGAGAVHRHVVQQAGGIATGQRVLDIGCGPGRLLDSLPAVDYVGLDLSAAYVEAAERRYGDRASFHLLDVSDARLDDEAPFDVVFAIGVLHHLDDGEAARLVGLAAERLGRGGRLVTLDPALTGGQPALARWLARRDRGLHVRSPAGYRAAAEASFGSVAATVRHDLAAVPYTHASLVCREPRERAAG